jgi:hypothetical protein
LIGGRQRTTLATSIFCFDLQPIALGLVNLPRCIEGIWWFSNATGSASNASSQWTLTPISFSYILINIINNFQYSRCLNLVHLAKGGVHNTLFHRTHLSLGFTKKEYSSCQYTCTCFSGSKGKSNENKEFMAFFHGYYHAATFLCKRKQRIG